jgi:ABC-type sugar transport system ATPase subunit
MSALTLTNLTKTFPGGQRAVDDVSLDINDGEFLVLVGPSGCGKSTTLRMIAGLEEISGGEIRIGERVVNGVAPKDRNISMVFQNYALYPHMTVRKNMSFGLELRYGGGLVERSLRRVLRPGKAAQLGGKRQGIAAKVEQTAELLQISHLLGRMPGQLSGGERQRVALGRAIVREPEVFLFDEPLSNLDAKLRVEMRRELKQLHRRLGTTMIYVTHDQVEAMTLGERIVIMDHGVVQQADAPLNLYRRPANRFVAGFIGSPPMNFIRGKQADGVFHHAEGAISLGNGEHRFSGAAGGAWLGVRPEDIYASAAGPSLGSVMLDVVEQMGHESVAYFRLAGERCAMRLPPDSGLNAGDRLEPRIRPDAWHLFADDAEGRRLA